MHSRQDPSSALLRLARLQAGVITREQALAHGLPNSSIRRLVHQGHWQPVVPGVFVIGMDTPAFSTRAWAAVLAAGDGAMLGGRAAAHEWGLCPDPPQLITVLVDQDNNRQAPHWACVVRRRHLPRSVGQLPRSCVEATVVDLAAAEPDRMVHWVTTALAQRRTTSAQLRVELDNRSRLPRGVRHRMLQLLDDADGLESVLEHAFATQVLRPHGLPEGTRQARRGRRRHDLRIGPLLIELDGRRGHEDTTGRFRDMERDNQALTEGLVTLRYGFHDCWNSPCDVAQQVAIVLARLGVSHDAHPCTRCPPEMKGVRT